LTAALPSISVSMFEPHLNIILIFLPANLSQHYSVSL
jgi:hypothetical protein